MSDWTSIINDMCEGKEDTKILKSLSPTDMCKCGSIDISFLEDHTESYTRYEVYECDKCTLSWVVEFTLSGVKEL